MDPIDVLILPTLRFQAAEFASVHGTVIDWNESFERPDAGSEFGDLFARFEKAVRSPTRKVQLGMTAADGTTGFMTLIGNDELLLAGRPGPTKGIRVHASSSLRGCAELMARQLTGDWIASAAPGARTETAWWTTASFDGHRVVGATACAFARSDAGLSVDGPDAEGDPDGAVLDDLAQWLVDRSMRGATADHPVPVSAAAADADLADAISAVRAMRTTTLVLATADLVTIVESGPAGTVRFRRDGDQAVDCVLSSRGAIGELIEVLHLSTQTGATFALSAEFAGREATWRITDAKAGGWVLSGLGQRKELGRSADALIAAVVTSVAEHVAIALR